MSLHLRHIYVLQSIINIFLQFLLEKKLHEGLIQEQTNDDLLFPDTGNFVFHLYIEYFDRNKTFH